MPLYQWSTTPASNASAGAIDWAEGQPPSTVNDSARQMMADVATWFQSPEWLNYGLTPTYVSATQYTLVGNQTAIHSVGRRVRATVTAGTIYGTISASAFTSLTAVTVAWDSGSLDSGVSEVDVGILNPVNPSVSTLPQLTLSGNSISGSLFFTASGYMPSIRSNNAAARLEFVNSANSSYMMLVDNSGNLTAFGNITANSDERLKTDWKSLPVDFVERLAAVKSGTYTRVDMDQRHVGVGAKSLQPLMPEAVIESAEGVLSVAYGQAALAACVALAKEVMRLRALLEPVK
ncbi:hypothetical protein R75461_01126 [Paraburkholderia nemoris]|uniref:tail fiber domain-containing protein n=1 Tax=Paraburkholderia nemoris TaxID=2793076 RepID=UPI001B1DBD1E|nr:tail fiber domain-containing protein [Paraburkholderia nemoris]CAE6712579.1 hypothetical protein R75461_01126 [Paraburkholderia nemoris]